MLVILFQFSILPQQNQSSVFLRNFFLKLRKLQSNTKSHSIYGRLDQFIVYLSDIGYLVYINFILIDRAMKIRYSYRFMKLKMIARRNLNIFLWEKK